MCPLCPCSGTTAQYGGACVPYVPVDYRDIGDTCSSSSILCCSTTTSGTTTQYGGGGACSTTTGT